MCERIVELSEYEDQSDHTYAVVPLGYCVSDNFMSLHQSNLRLTVAQCTN